MPIKMPLGSSSYSLVKEEGGEGGEGVSRRTISVGGQYMVRRIDHPPRPATILDTRPSKLSFSSSSKSPTREYYISFVGQDKRLDAWIKEVDIGEKLGVSLDKNNCGGPSTSERAVNEVGSSVAAPAQSLTTSALAPAPSQAPLSTPPVPNHSGAEQSGFTALTDAPAEGSRGREGPNERINAKTNRRAEQSPSGASTPEREHAAMTRVRNFEDVRFGEYLVKTWYWSPYPLPLNDQPHPHHNTLSHPPSTPTPSTAFTAKLTSEPSSSRKRKFDQASTPSRADPANKHTHPPSLAHTSSAGPSDSQSQLSMGPTTPQTASTQTHAQETSTPQSSRSKPTRTVSEMFGGVGKGGEGARGRIWVCDLCFKYMRTRSSWDRHSSNCSMLQPPGRRVYQRGSYTIWEIDGAEATLYCQNLSLFGKLFIDHKSVFFHVENFLFYVLCDAATSKRDQVMAFFSKEKLSYDDYNLACIVTFPPHQNRSFGKLLIEFSYYLTLHPSTRPANLSPGTPERPLSDLGLKGYTAYWVSVILRFFRQVFESVEPYKPKSLSESSPKKSPVKVPVVSKTITGETSAKTATEGRTLRVRKPLSSSSTPTPGIGGGNKVDKLVINDQEIIKTPISGFKGQCTINLTLKEIANATHLRVDDVAFTLSELGFMSYRRARNGAGKASLPIVKHGTGGHLTAHGHSIDDHGSAKGEDDTQGASLSSDKSTSGHGSKDGNGGMGEWKDVEIVISRDLVNEAVAKWRVRDKGVLDDEYVLL